MPPPETLHRRARRPGGPGDRRGSGPPHRCSTVDPVVKRRRAADAAGKASAASRERRRHEIIPRSNAHGVANDHAGQPTSPYAARYPTLDEAMDALETECRAVATSHRRQEIKVARRTYDPVRPGAGRVELTGPGGSAAGIDVRGDGSDEAFTGRMRKRLVEHARGRDALRRVLGGAVELQRRAVTRAASPRGRASPGQRLEQRPEPRGVIHVARGGTPRARRRSRGRGGASSSRQLKDSALDAEPQRVRCARIDATSSRRRRSLGDPRPARPRRGGTSARSPGRVLAGTSSASPRRWARVRPGSSTSAGSSPVGHRSRRAGHARQGRGVGQPPVDPGPQLDDGQRRLAGGARAGSTTSTAPVGSTETRTRRARLDRRTV